MKIAHISHARAGCNYGDSALTFCVQKTFECLFNEDIEWDMIEVKDWKDKNNPKEFDKYDMIIVGGGGLFMRHGNSNNPISGWQWAIRDNNLKKIKPPIVLFTVGFNYFWGQKPIKRFMESVQVMMNKSIHFSLRHRGDIRSLEKYLPQHHSPIHYQPCTTTIIDKLWGLEEQKGKTNKIGINVPFDRDDLRYRNKNEIMRNISKGIRKLYDKGYEIVIILHIASKDSEIKDYLDRENIKYSVVDISTMSLLESFSFYKSFDLIIGGRGHAQMIPFGLGTPILSLYCHEKLKFFLEDIGKEDWLINIFDIDSIVQNIEKKGIFILENKDFIQKEIKTIQNELFNMTKDNIQYIKAVTHVN